MTSPALSPREMEIMRLVARGEKNTAIADALKISRTAAAVKLALDDPRQLALL
jgi:DNA-binding NarL/FixJ family response regulator